MTSPAHVVITGSSGSLGQLMVNALLARESTRGIVGIDLRPPAAPPGDRRFCFHRGDVAEGLDGLAALHDVPAGGAWLHLAYPLDPRVGTAAMLRVATAGTEAFLRAAARGGAAKLLVLSSAMIYGTRAGEERISEESALAADREMAYAEGKRRLESLAGRWPLGGAELVIARPCTVLGPGVGRHAMMDELFGERGVSATHDPRLQFLHEADFVDAALRMLRPGVRGVYNLAPSDGGVRGSELARLLGLELPAVAYDELRRQGAEAWERGLPGALHPATLDYLFFEWVVANDKARAQLGWEPAWSSLDTFWSYLRAQKRRRKAEPS